MSDYNAFGSRHDAFRDSGFNARSRACEPMLEIFLDCATPHREGLYFDPCLFGPSTPSRINARTFSFYADYPGDYTIRLANVVGISPHAAPAQTFVSTVLPGYVYVTGSELTVTMEAPGLIEGVVGAEDGRPGRFDIAIESEDDPDHQVQVSGTFIAFEGDPPEEVVKDCLAYINEVLGTAFTGLLTRPCGAYYWEETSEVFGGPLGDPWRLRLTYYPIPFSSDWYWTFDTGPNTEVTLGRDNLPGPYGRIDVPSGAGAFVVDIIPVP